MNSQAKVGLLVLVGAAILVYSTFRIENIKIGSSKGYFLRSYFESVAGLDKKSSVKVAGVGAGKVKDIRLKPDGHAEVLMQMNKDITIHYGAEASIRSSGLLGEKYVDITPGSINEPLYKDGDTLPSSSKSVDIDELAGKLSAISLDVKAVTSSFKHVFGGEGGKKSLQNIFENVEVVSDNLVVITRDVKEIIRSNQNQLQQIIDNVNNLTANIDKLVSKNESTVNDSLKNILQITKDLSSLIKENRLSLDKTIDNMKEFTHTLRKDSPDITSKMKEVLDTANEILIENRAILNKSMNRIELATRKLNDSLDNIGEFTKQIKSGKGTIGKLIYTEDTYNNLNKGLKKVTKLLGKMDDLKTYIGVRAEYNTREAKSKTYVSLKIQPSEDKYYLLEVVDDPLGNRRTKTTVTETENLNTGEMIREEEEKETITEDEIKFSLQLAKRFYDFVIRGGIIESSGGFGLDYYFLDDKLKFSLEAWDFSEKDAHLKFTSQYFVQNNIFLELGGDDLANDDYRNIFFGAGILFSDDDIKYLIGSGGIPLPR